jgi:hypothetical protein
MSLSNGVFVVVAKGTVHQMSDAKTDTLSNVRALINWAHQSWLSQ